jgi:dipeptidase E
MSSLAVADPALRLLLLSNSRNPAGQYLVHAREALASFAGGRTHALFIPFAGITTSWDDYLTMAQQALEPVGLRLQGAHQCVDLGQAIASAEMLLVGGGNTFCLLHALRQRGALQPIREAVARGVPYVGWSAGTVLATPSIATTNDMPIVDPGGFDALGLVSFQINAHYTNALPGGHQGETRNQRIAEFLVRNPARPVLGLPEGNWLELAGSQIALHGPHSAWWFRSGHAPVMLESGPLDLARMVTERQ